MLDEKEMTGPVQTSADTLRDEDGAIRPDFVARVQEAIAARDSGTLRTVVGDLHEADTGDLIEALDPELRPRLIELMGKDFDFSALTEVDDTVREEILEELEPETVAEGVREPEVGYTHPTVGSHQDVFRLEVGVDDPACVCFRQGQGDRLGDGVHTRQSELSSSEQLAQRLLLEEHWIE